MIQARPLHALPESILSWGWRYHHLGIPTKDTLPNERYVSKFKLHTSGFDTSPFGVEWMRFDSDSPVHELIQTVPHVAFEVDDIDEELAKHKLKVLAAPNSPGEGIRVAVIEHNGAPIELIEFSQKNP